MGGATAAGAVVAARWTSAEAVTALAFSAAAAAPDPNGADGLLAVGGETGVVVLHVRPTASDDAVTAADLAGTRCVTRSGSAQARLSRLMASNDNPCASTYRRLTCDEVARWTTGVAATALSFAADAQLTPLAFRYERWTAKPFP